MYFYITLLVRVLLAIVFLISGFLKGLEYNLTVNTIKQYFAIFGIDIGNSFVIFCIAIGLIALELLIGFMLLYNSRKRMFRFIVFVVSFCFLVLIFYVRNNDAISDCGCFGTLLPMDLSTSLKKNIILVVLSAYLIFDLKISKEIGVRINNTPLLIVYFFIIIFCGSAILIPSSIDNSEYGIGSNICKYKKDRPLLELDINNKIRSSEFNYLFDNLADIEQPTCLLFIRKITSWQELNYLHDIIKQSESPKAIYPIVPILSLSYSEECPVMSDLSNLITIDESLYNSVFSSDYGIIKIRNGYIIEKSDFNKVSLSFFKSLQLNITNFASQYAINSRIIFLTFLFIVTLVCCECKKYQQGELLIILKGQRPFYGQSIKRTKIKSFIKT